MEYLRDSAEARGCGVVPVPGVEALGDEDQAAESLFGTSGHWAVVKGCLLPAMNHYIYSTGN